MNRIRELRKAQKMTMRELGKLVGVSESTISLYETGRHEPDLVTLGKIADTLGTTVDYLVGRHESDAIIQLVRKAVPILGDIACGDPITAEENMDGHADLPDGIRADFALRCKGTSMEPTFADGDLVLIRQQEEVPDGKIAAVLIGSEATLKRVHRIPDGVMLIPDNSQDFSPLIYQREEAAEVRIIGLAVGYVRLI